MFRWFAYGTFACACLLFYGCGPAGPKQEELDKYPVINPIVKDTVITTEYVADIHSLRNVELRSRVKGFVEKMYVDEGQQVKAGQLLFSISSQAYRQDLLKAKAMLNSAIADAKVAEVDVANAQKLVDKNVVSKSELEMAKAKWEASKARVEEARAHEASAELLLELTDIRAPFEGLINRIPNKIGSLIEEGTLLTTLSDNSDVFCYFNVSEADYLDFVSTELQNSSRQVDLVLANHALHPVRGIIETVEGEIDKSTGNIAFRARFANPKLVLKHGSTGKVRLGRAVNGALLLPQKATFEIQDNTYVYVVDEQNKVRLRQIVPLHRLSSFYVVEAGVAPADKVLLEGIQRVKDGDEVVPQMVDARVLMSQLAKATVLK